MNPADEVPHQPFAIVTAAGVDVAGYRFGWLVQWFQAVGVSWWHVAGCWALGAVDQVLLEG